MLGRHAVDAQLSRSLGLTMKEIEPILAGGGDSAEKKFMECCWCLWKADGVELVEPFVDAAFNLLPDKSRSVLFQRMLTIVYVAQDSRSKRLQQSFPEIQQLLKTYDVIGTARKIIDSKNFEKISNGLRKLADTKLPHSIIKQAASDLQLKDLFAKAEALFAKANLTLSKDVSNESLPTQTPPNDETSSTVSPSKKAGLKKTPSRKTELQQTVSKKMPSKKKTKRALKRSAMKLS
jgi:hypothetical protein